jgi:hypothetical protein
MSRGAVGMLVRRNPVQTRVTRRSRVRSFVIWSTVIVLAAVFVTSWWFFHQVAGLTPLSPWSDQVREWREYRRTMWLMLFWFWLNILHIPFISDALEIVRAIGRENVPIDEMPSFYAAMVSLQALVCLVPINVTLLIFLLFRWLVRRWSAP